MEKISTTAIINGVANNTISVLDRGFNYGDGLFETMLAVGEDIPFWQLHYDRLCRGMQALDIPLELPVLTRQMRVVLDSINLMESERVVVKLIVTRGEGGRGYQSPEQIKPNLITLFTPLLPDVLTEEGVKVHYCQQLLPPQPLPGIKSLNQLTYVLASQERLHSDYAEGLLFNKQEQLVEATARNVFLVDKNKTLLTPKLNRYGIEGIMRRLIIDTIAPALDITVRQTAINKADIVNAQEFFLTNSVTQIWPVVGCEGRQWCQGPITMAIKHAVSKFLQNEKRFCCREHTAMWTAASLD